MRVIVNAECTYLTRAGVGHHTSELLGALRARIGADRVGTYPTALRRFYDRQVVRCHRCSERGGWLAAAEERARRGVLAAVRWRYPALEHTPLALAARRGGYDLYHEPNYLAHPCDLPTVVTIHDLSVLLHPEWHPADRVAAFERRFRDGLAGACHLIAVSEFTKQEIVRELGWPAERVSVTYNGRRPFLRPLSAGECVPTMLRLGLKPGYVLHVGTVEPRKNLGLLLRAHGGLPMAVRQRHPLVLVGGTGWRANDLENELAARQRDGTVRRLGYCADADLSALYGSARVLAFPTRYEGFGMPTVEMLACGGAVLASTAGAVAETVGGAAHLLDPSDEGGWRDALLRACTDDAWWGELRAGAEAAAAPFTWDRCAQQTLAAYRKALGGVEIETRAA